MSNLFRTVLLQVRPYAAALVILHSQRESLGPLRLTHFANCKTVSYVCDQNNEHEDSECFPAMDLALSCAVGQLQQMESVKLDFRGVLDRQAC